MSRAPNKVTMRVLVRGRVFDSVRECAEALGVSKNTVYSAVHRGTTDTLGFGRGYMPENPDGKRGGATPIQIGPYKYRSEAAACRALGFYPGYLKRHRNAGTEQKALQELEAAAMIRLAEEEEAARNRSKPR